MIVLAFDKTRDAHGDGRPTECGVEGVAHPWARRRQLVDGGLGLRGRATPCGTSITRPPMFLLWADAIGGTLVVTPIWRVMRWPSPSCPSPGGTERPDAHADRRCRPGSAPRRERGRSAQFVGS